MAMLIRNEEQIVAVGDVVKLERCGMYVLLEGMRKPRNCSECRLMYHNPLFDEDLCCYTGDCVGTLYIPANCPIKAEADAEYVNHVFVNGHPRMGEWWQENGKYKCPLCGYSLNIQPELIGYSCCPKCGAVLDARVLNG